MVIWVFAGGGEAEARGLLPFLQAQFTNCTFERKFPAGFKQNAKKPRNYNPTVMGQYYSKGTDTPDLIQRISVNTVAQKCVHFRQLWQKLSISCSDTA